MTSYLPLPAFDSLFINWWNQTTWWHCDVNFTMKGSDQNRHQCNSHWLSRLRRISVSIIFSLSTTQYLLPWSQTYLISCLLMQKIACQRWLNRWRDGNMGHGVVNFSARCPVSHAQAFSPAPSGFTQKGNGYQKQGLPCHAKYVYRSANQLWTAIWY